MTQCIICGDIIDENGDEEQICEECQLNVYDTIFFGLDEDDCISDDV